MPIPWTTARWEDWFYGKLPFKKLYLLLYSQQHRMHSYVFSTEIICLMVKKMFNRVLLTLKIITLISTSSLTVPSRLAKWLDRSSWFLSALAMTRTSNVSPRREQMSFHLKSLYKICFNWLCLLANHLANLHLSIMAFQFGPGDWKGFFICRQS